MKEIKIIFNNYKFRVFDNNGEPWFVLRDICKILGFKNYTDQLIKLGADGVDKIYLTDSIGRKQEAYIISEPSLYRLVLKSTVKQAKVFQNKVFNEILPQIRKTGRYVDLDEKTIRLKSAKKRNIFTDTLKSHGISKPNEYIQLLGINKKKKKAECDLIEVIKIGMAEYLSTLNIIQDDVNGFKEVRPVVKTSSKKIKEITEKKAVGK